MRSLITLSFSLFIGSVMSLKDSDSADEQGDDFQLLHWKESSTKNTFKIKTNNNIRLQVVDYKNAGDVFEVFDNGISLGKTSTPSDAKGGNVDYAFIPEEALEKEGFSKGAFELLAGNHKITIKAISPYSEGTTAVRLLGGKGLSSMRMIKRGSDEYAEDEDKEYDADDEDEEEDNCDDEEDGGHEHEKWDKKKKYHNVKEENADNGWNGDDSGNDEDCITDVDDAHTLTLLKTVYVDSPDRPFHYVTVGDGMGDNNINLDINGNNYAK